MFKTMTANSYQREVERLSVAGHIEHLFEEAFGYDEGITIMNTIFFILLHRGSEYLPVRSYAWEIMKLFGHLLLPELGITAEEFITKFSRFTLKKLCTNAICEVASRPSAEEVRQGTYGIRRTVFLEVLLELQY